MGAADEVDPNSSLWAWLTYDLRFYRNKHDQTLAAVAGEINRSMQWLSNVENGRRRLKEEEAEILDRIWNTGGHFVRLMMFAKKGHDPNWGQQHLEHEAAARVLKIYELAIVPGLLQTEEYARASFMAARSRDMEAQLEARMSRQEALTRQDPPTVWVLLDEGVLDHQVGSPKIMAEQLSKLLDVSHLPHVSLRIVPRTVGWHFGLEGSFKVMSVTTGDVVYTEACGGGRLISDPEEVRALILRHDRIGEWALPVDSSRKLISSKMEAMR